MTLRRDVKTSLRRVAKRFGLAASSGPVAKRATRSPNIERFKDYEQNWAPVLDSINWVIDTEGETSLSRAFAMVSGMYPATPVDYGAHQIVSCGDLARVPAAGFAGIYSDILLKTVLEMCGRSADTILELGSGWGSYLFRAWLDGGPRAARYYACEYTRTGRACTQRMATLEPDLSITPIAFDYRNPDFSAVEAGARTVAFTSHSIEQVAVLPRELFERLLALSPDVSGLHLEPVGWQVRLERGEKLPPFSEAHMRRCQKYEYNRNLWPLLLELQADGLINIQDVIPDVIGVDYNPSTLIRWVKR
jgi:hypothetical protein